MTDKRRFILASDQARRNCAQFAWTGPDGWQVVFQPVTRSLEANAAMWATLGDIAEQVVWHGRKLNSECWKHIFSSSLKKQDVVPNLDGTGFVVMGVSTSKMTKREMSDLLELAHSFGVQHGVKFRDIGVVL